MPASIGIAGETASGKSTITEKNIEETVEQIKMALLEADVNFKVVKDFTKKVEARAIGQDVMNGLNPGQMVIKIVDEELTSLMGRETSEISYLPGQAITVIMMVGLQGAGKTTTAAKLAGQMKTKGKRPLLVACDVYRPAAVEQLRVLADDAKISFYGPENKNDSDVLKVVKGAKSFADSHMNDVIILDTAGRLHIDDELMAELKNIAEILPPHEKILVVDAMTGQEAVNAAKSFHELLNLTGLILTKLDGDRKSVV